jgi:hypothetical protein
VNRPLMIGPDGLVESATSREMAHLGHCLERASQSTTLHSSVGPARESIVFPRRSRTAAGAPMKSCPLCSSQVREDRLQKHMSSRCPFRLGGPEHHKPARQVVGKPHSIANVFQRLSASSKPRRPSKLGRRVPVPIHPQVEKTRHSMESAPQKSGRQVGNVQVERPSWGDDLDATKNCGYPAREEGRYGSYPSHDGFDDESKP